MLWCANMRTIAFHRIAHILIMCNYVVYTLNVKIEG